MWRYILRRLILMLPMLLGISIISFFVMQLAPGDALTQRMLQPNMDPKVIELLRKQFGLDEPFHIQYLRWLSRLVQLDFGHSFNYQAPVSWLVGTRVLNTLLLSLASLVLAWVIAIPIGIYSATRPYNVVDRTLTFLAFIGLSIPNFFLALVLLFVVVKLDLPLPVGGMTSSNFAQLGFWERIADVALHMVVPVVVIGTSLMASLMRYMRSNLLDALRQDYVTTARAKGLAERRVVWKHAVRNAINPLITIFGFELGNILSGQALTEIVTGWPGMGRLTLEALLQFDYYVVMAVLVIGGVMLVLGNLTADILLAWSDPRIRYD